MITGVHDSYWTHACDVDELSRILREKFVELYETPILENLLESFERSFPTLSFPPLPERGDFDLRDVLESPYFFNWSDARISLYLGLQWSLASADVFYLWQFSLFLPMSGEAKEVVLSRCLVENCCTTLVYILEDVPGHWHWEDKNMVSICFMQPWTRSFLCPCTANMNSSFWMYVCYVG